jgi:hypothetical protein
VVIRLILQVVTSWDFFKILTRIDLIVLRDSKETRFLPSPMQVTGNRQRDKTDSGRWPSDHASVAAKVRSKSYGRDKPRDWGGFKGF